MTFGSTFGRVFSPTFQPKSQAAAAASTFVPTDITGCKLWLDFGDADYLFTDAGSTKVSSDGDAIYQASDKSGNNYHAVQTASANRPLYKTGIQNSKSVARFDGSNDYFTISSISVASGSKSLFVAYNNAEGLNGSSFASHYLIDSQTGRLIFAGVTGNSNFANVAWYDGSWHDIAAPANGWQTLGFVLASGGNGTIYRNSSSLGSAAYTDKAISGVTTISRAHNNSNNYLTGDIGEMILYDSALSDTDRGKVETYLNNKWTIY